jgi:tetratricopeptide (TPR) repeat protein
MDPLDAAKGFLRVGRLAEAEKACLSVLGSSPKDSRPRLIIATVKLRQGDLAGADRWASRSNLDSHEGLTFQTEYLWKCGRAADAVSSCEKLVHEFPEDAEAWNLLGFFTSTLGQHAKSAECFEKAARLIPGFPYFHVNLGNAYKELDRPLQAIGAYRKAVQLSPKMFEVWAALAQQLVSVADLPEAAACSRKAFELERETSRGLIEGARAEIYSGGDLNHAEACLRKAVKKDPSDGANLGLLGFVLQKLGNSKEAQDCLREAIRLKPSDPGPYGDLAGTIKVTEADRALIERMAEMTDDAGRTGYERRMLNHALGKAHDDLKEFDIAMQRFDEAHRIDRETFGRGFDRVAYQLSIDLMIRLFDDQMMAVDSIPCSNSNKPIFIVGMMRSGTTLVEQILSNHPDVAGAGEINFWVRRLDELMDPGRTRLLPPKCGQLVTDYLELLSKAGNGKPRVTDKMPDNYRVLGLIHLLFPNARIIHCTRNPIDTCLSIYMQPFISPPGYVHNKSDLAFAYREYRRLMEHWRRLIPSGNIFEADYQELVSNPEKVVREMLGFCDLPWHDACLHPETNRRAVFTASHWQVRQPVYQSSVERWRNYEPWLGELQTLQELSIQTG